MTRILGIHYLVRPYETDELHKKLEEKKKKLELKKEKGFRKTMEKRGVNDKRNIR